MFSLLSCKFNNMFHKSIFKEIEKATNHYNLSSIDIKKNTNFEWDHFYFLPGPMTSLEIKIDEDLDYDGYVKDNHIRLVFFKDKIVVYEEDIGDGYNDGPIFHFKTIKSGHRIYYKNESIFRIEANKYSSCESCYEYTLIPIQVENSLPSGELP